ncbi:MAG: RsmE family RNA methyltransferase [Bacteroidia bacterium]
MTTLFWAQVEGSVAWLEGQEAHHCVHVLRCKPGQEVWLTQGRGIAYRGVITRIEREPLQVEVEVKTFFPGYGEPPSKVGIAFSLLKDKARNEWLLEKGTELGVTDFFVMRYARTIPRQAPLERWEKILKAAVKQNLRSQMPSLVWVESLEALPVEDFSMRLIASKNAPLLLARAVTSSPVSTLCVIGPEGDFIPEEIAFFASKDFKVVDLGQTRLRAETAAIMCVAFIKGVWGY